MFNDVILTLKHICICDEYFEGVAYCDDHFEGVCNINVDRYMRSALNAIFMCPFHNAVLLGYICLTYFRYVQ